MTHSRLLAYVSGQLWAIRPDVGATMVSTLSRRASGVRLSEDEIRERLDAAIGARHPHDLDSVSGRLHSRRWDPETGEFYALPSDLGISPVRDSGEPSRFVASDYYAVQGGGAPMRKGGGVIAVLGVYGILSPRASAVDDMSGPGGTAVESLSKRFDRAMADSEVKAILFDHDSPGGNVVGVTELAAKMRSSRGSKPIWHIANGSMASASYWLGSQADKGGLMASPSSELGSVGVYSIHEDLSRALEAEGVTVSILADGANKTLGNPFEPLSPEARDAIMVRVSQAADQFRADIAKGRGVPLDSVRKGFGDGLIFGARDAASRGMADGVATMEETLRRMARGPVAQVTVPAMPAAAAEEVTLAAAMEAIVVVSELADAGAAKSAALLAESRARLRELEQWATVS